MSIWISLVSRFNFKSILKDYGLGIIAILIAFFGAYLKYILSEPLLVEKGNNGGHSIKVSANDHLKWVKTFEGEVVFARIVNEDRNRWQRKIIVGLNNRKRRFGEMLCYSWNGKKLDFGDTVSSIDMYGEKYNSGIYVLKEVIYTTDNNENPRLVALFGEGYFNENIVVIYNMKLKRLGQFHNPGSVTFLSIAKDGNSKKCIIIAGVNNDLTENEHRDSSRYRSFIAKLSFPLVEGQEIKAQAPPYLLDTTRKKLADKAEWYRAIDQIYDPPYDFAITDIDGDSSDDLTIIGNKMYKSAHIDLDGNLITNQDSGVNQDTRNQIRLWDEKLCTSKYNNSR